MFVHYLLAFASILLSTASTNATVLPERLGVSFLSFRHSF